MKKIPKYTLSAFVALIVLFLLSFPIGGNVWGLVTGRGYEIPESSSVFTFRPTLMNAGSGEWWAYGEDKKFYYYQDGTKFLKGDAINCSGFDPLLIETWCK